MRIFIDLDKEELPDPNIVQDKFDLKYNGRLVVKDSTLWDIDTLKIEELEYIPRNFKEYLESEITSQYIPSVEAMQIVLQLAPDFKVRIKTEKPGCPPLIAITPKEFFRGEAIFSKILEGIDESWTDIEKFKYLYTYTGLILSYDIEAVTYDKGTSEREKLARNIFTAVVKNCAICSTFAAMCDYLCYRANLESEVISEYDHDYLVFTDEEEKDFLGDPTFDSVALKFGLRPTNFATSKEQFQQSHSLEDTDTDEYKFESLDEETILAIDRRIGYLKSFGDQYTDHYVYGLAKNLEGDSTLERALCFLNRIATLKSLGRTNVHDYMTLINRVLSASKDAELTAKIKTFPFIDGDKTLRLGIKIEDESAIHLYTFEEDFRSFKEIEMATISKTL